MSSNYWEAELSGIKTSGEDDAVKVKLMSKYTDTKWLTLRPSEFEAVEALLVELYAAREQESGPAQKSRQESRARQQATAPANSLEAMQAEADRRKQS